MSRIPLPVARIVLPLGVVVGVFVLVAASARSSVLRNPPETPGRVSVEADPIVVKVDQLFAKRWADNKIAPANPADDLTILRRLSQVLHGTVPSLEEIRVFEADAQPKRIERWVER